LGSGVLGNAAGTAGAELAMAAAMSAAIISGPHPKGAGGDVPASRQQPAFAGG
jgi:hypothetical protein